MNNRLDELAAAQTRVVEDDFSRASFTSCRSSRSSRSSNTSTNQKSTTTTKYKKRKAHSALKKKVWQKIKASKNGKSSTQKIEVTVTPGEARAKLMELFYDNVESLMESMRSIAKATKAIKYTTHDILEKSLSSEEEKKLDARVCNLVDRTNQRAQAIRLQLKSIQQETKELQTQNTIFVQSDFRIRDFLVSALTKKFVDELRKYQAAQGNYKLKTQKKLKRQLKTVHPSATDEEIDGMIQRGEDRDTLFQQAILAPHKVNDRIRGVHQNVSEKYRAIQQIEQSAAMIHQLFSDMALLVEEQGEMLDRIEFHVMQASDYIEQGNDNMHEATEYSKKANKKKRMILLLVGVVVVVLVVAIAL